MGEFPNMVSGLMQWALLTAETWCKEVRLLANPDKTELVVLTRKRNLLGFLEQHFFCVNLSRNRLFKHLGVFLDSRLT